MVPSSSASTKSAISLKELTKTYGERTVVNRVSLEIASGGVYGLLGPNGAGKTTIVRMLSTVIKPSAGSANVNGFDVTSQPDLVRQSIGVLPEDTGLYDRLNAVETLRFYGGLQGVSERRLEERIDQLLDLLELDPKRHDRVSTYSRGMRQKLALARAMIHDPPILLLDEPTLGLDVMSTRAIRDYTRTAASEGKTILLTTNNMYEAQLLCDRLTIISNGSIRASGTVGDLEDLARTKGLEEVFINLVRGDGGR
jgi:ABC-type multidrug transport system ATPase subunit